MEKQITLEDIKLTDWFLTRPKLIQEVIETYSPLKTYRFKSSKKQCVIIAYDEPESGLLKDVTVIVQKTGKGGAMDEMGLGVLDTNQVFGVKLEDLEIVE